MVSFGYSGLTSDASGTVVTINSVSYAESALPVSLWVDSGNSVAYSFAGTVASSGSPSNTQYLWDSTSGLDTLETNPSLTVSGAGTVTGNYVTRYSSTVTAS